MFKLVLLPPYFYDLAFNVNHSKPGNLANSLVATCVALVVSLIMSCVLYFTGLLGLGYIECWMLTLSLQTVDVDPSATHQSKTMSLAVNCFVLLLTQYLSFEDNSAGQVLLLIFKQTIGPILIAGIAALITIMPLKLKLHKEADDSSHEGHSLQG